MEVRRDGEYTSGMEERKVRANDEGRRAPELRKRVTEGMREDEHGKSEDAQEGDARTIGMMVVKGKTAKARSCTPSVG